MSCIALDIALAADVAENLHDLGHEFEDSPCHLNLGNLLIALKLLLLESLLDFVVVVLECLVPLLVLVIFVS